MLRGVISMAKEFSTVFKGLTMPRDTYPYPEKRREYSPRFRGKHMLAKDAEGLDLCVGCGLCEAVCPAHAIRVVATEPTPEHPNLVSWTSRYASDFEVDLIRCIFCGMCEEACPTNAIRLTPFNEMATYNRLDMIADKEELMRPALQR
jgi:NADH-quinone oxidoreductase subunit I